MYNYVRCSKCHKKYDSVGAFKAPDKCSECGHKGFDMEMCGSPRKEKDLFKFIK